jgi:hypothetical protein
MDEQLEKLARKRAKAKMGWYIHATVYLLVNTMLAVLSLAMGHYWAAFPAFGWGLGLAIHGIVVFGITGNGGFYERLLASERARLARQ